MKKNAAAACLYALSVVAIAVMVWTHLPPSQPAQATPFAEISLNSTTESQELNVTNLCVVGIQMPGTWTAADIEFTCSEVSGGTFNDVYDAAGTQVAIVTAAARYIDLTGSGNQVCGCSFLKAKSSNAQASARVVVLQLAR